MIKQELFVKLLRFGITGGLSALTLMGLTQLFAGWWGKQVGFLAAYPIALFVHFSLNKWWTFNSRTRVNVRQVRDYGILSVVTFLLQWSVYTLVTSWLKAPLFIGTLSSVAAQMVLSFIVMERRVFAHRTEATQVE